MRWKRLLLWLCAATILWTAASAIDNFGVDGRAWYGWWDANYVPTGRPFVATFQRPEAGGATARAGIVGGDWFDLREQSLRARVSLAAQPLAGRRFDLIVHRGRQRFTARIVGSTLWQVGTAAKQWTVDVGLITSCWFIVCAFLIAMRRANLFEGRMLALVLLCEAAASTGLGNAMTVPDPRATLALFILPQVCGLLSMLLLVTLSTRFGVRHAARRIAETLAYTVIGVAAIELAMFVYGVVSLGIDPLQVGWLNFNFAPVTAALLLLSAVSVVVVAGFMVVNTPEGERSRAAWLIVPLAVANLLTNVILNVFAQFVDTWAANQALVQLANACLLAAAFAVTYALLRRRVLDFEFVLSRTVVVATISLIVIVSFILLEWLLGTVLSGVSRNEGILANALLALVLGLSLRYIHIRVDAFIDAILFRKRHADERALLDFAEEAAYATESSALLDTALAKIKQHTDARSAALFVEQSRSYEAARSYGNGEFRTVDENDAAILALKAAHKPIDPHHYETALAGAIAVPMYSRGRVLGVLLLGERAGNEAYAPDEVEALSKFGQGVGSALDLLSTRHDGAIEALHEAITNGLALLNEAVRALPDAIAERLRDSAPS